MNPLYNKAHFIKSVRELSDLPPDEGIEVVFAGRSNAGKSNALNAITGIGNLARVSKTPGRTQLINFFGLDEGRRLVDLPGYGYAKVPEATKRYWQNTLGKFLEKREAIHGLILVMDVRHPLREFDLQMLEWCRHQGIPVHCLLTKADKLKRGRAKQTLMDVRKALKELDMDATVQLFSGTRKTGVDEAHAALDRWFGEDE